jgi:hypothetical protein
VSCFGIAGVTEPVRVLGHRSLGWNRVEPQSTGGFVQLAGLMGDGLSQ